MLQNLAYSLSLEEQLDEADHLLLFNQAVLVGVDHGEGLFELGLVVVVRRGDVSEHSLKESLRLGLVKSATVVLVKLFPDFVDSLSVDTVLLDLSREPS